MEKLRKKEAEEGASRWKLLRPSISSKQDYRKFSFGCSSLDTLFKGGLPETHDITEIYGASGTGKTQICLQLAVSCAKRGLFCAYINTEKQFPIPRLVQMIQSIPGESQQKYLNSIWVAEKNEPSDVLRLLTHDLKILLNRRRVGLVIVDSVAGLFRNLSDDLIHRAELMRSFNRTILELQDEYKFAVVCTNQVAANIDGEPGEAAIKPCLGPIWTEFLTNRLLVTKHPQLTTSTNLCIRTLEADFSPFIPRDIRASFVVETSGLQNVPLN